MGLLCIGRIGQRKGLMVERFRVEIKPWIEKPLSARTT